MYIFDTIDIPNWFLILISGSISLYIYYEWFYSHFRKQGIPCQLPFPLVGTFLYAFIAGFKGILKKLDSNHKVFGAYNGHTPLIVIVDPEMVKQITVKQFNKFVNHQMIAFQEKPGSDMLVAMKDDQWKHVRNYLTPAFSAGKLKQMVYHINNASRQFAEHVGQYAAKGEEFDMKKICGCFTMDVIAGTAFGLQVNSQENPDDPFIKHGDAVMNFNMLKMAVSLIAPWLGIKVFPQESCNFFAEIMDQTMKTRRDEKGGPLDFTQMMLNVELQDDDDHRDSSEDTDDTHTALQCSTNTRKGLTKDEIFGQAFAFFIAGYDTTATGLSFLCYNLAVNPQCQDKVRAEVDDVMGEKEQIGYDDVNKMAYLDMCLQESLRLFPPIPQTDRVCLEDTEVEGYKIYKGWGAFIHVYGIHHDPDTYPDPFKFDPERFSREAKAARHPYAWLPFGLGPRGCIGLRLAMMEMKMAAATLIRKYQLVPSEKMEVPIKLDKMRMKSVNGNWLKAELI